MGIDSGQAIIIQGVSHDPAALTAATAKRIDVERLGEEQPVEVFEHLKLALTAVVVQLGELEVWSIDLDPAAKALARQLGVRTWAVQTFGGTEVWTRVAAFDAKGRKSWEDEAQDTVPAKALAAVQRRLGGRPKRPHPSDFPCWRLAADLPARPTKPLWPYGVTPVLSLEAPWKKVSTKTLRFSPEFVAKRQEEQRRAEADRLAREAAHTAARQREAEGYAEYLAQQKREQEAEARRLMDCTLVPGVAKELSMPAQLLALVEKLASKHEVEAAWVWQAAAAQSTPWKFPATALPSCPLVAPVPITLTVSPALEQALAKSSLARPDGSPASFDELVRVAVSVGLDDLKGELEENTRKRKKLARTSQRK